MARRLIIFAFCILLLSSSVSAAAVFSSSSSSARLINTQTYPTIDNLYSGSDLNRYWPVIDNEGQCRERQDLLLRISPAGCQPAVVRTDLLADQNVPVLCPIEAMQINPLIDIKAIDSITFSGRYPDAVATTGFYPAKAALSSGRALVNNPLLSNIGYAVVVLRRNQNESSVPESVRLNLTARVRYDSYNALGVGQAQFILEEQTEQQFNDASSRNSFWQGRYFIRADSFDANTAAISLYYQDRKMTTVQVERGKQSQEIFVPGFSTCGASMRVAYDGFETSASDRARIEVQDGNKKTDIFDVYEGSSFANGRCRVSGDIAANIDRTGSISISCSGQRTTLSISNAEGSGQTTDESSLNGNEKAYLAQVRAAIHDYSIVAETYPAERDGIAAYGEQALQKALDLIINSPLAIYLKNEYTDLLALYKDRYPESLSIAKYEQEQDKILKLNSANSAAVFQIDNKFVTVKVLEFNKAQTEAKVTFNVGGATREYFAGKTGDPFIQGTAISFGSNYRLSVTKINPEEVTISPSCPEFAGNVPRSEILSEGEQTTLCGVSIRVDDINAEKLAKVRILPKIDNTQTETNLTVEIGIEKRAIQLSPERTQTMINNLNESIKQFESISKTLNSATKGLKTACFATAAALTVKNFVGGLDGDALARKKTMQGANGDNGWTARCADAFRNQEPIPGTGHSPYVSIDDCFRKNAEAIDRDVNVIKNIQATQDAAIKPIDQKYSTETKPFGTQVNTDAAAKEYLAHLQDRYEDSFIDGIKPESIEKGDITYSQLRDYEYNILLQQSGASAIQKDAAKEQMTSLTTSLNQRAQETKASSDFAAEVGVNYNIQTRSMADAAPWTYNGQTGGSNIPVLNGKPVEFIVLGSTKYAAVLEQVNGNKYIAKELYRIENGQATAVPKNEQSPEWRSISGGFTRSTAMSHAYTNAKVKFFDSEPYKGTPAIVPIDTKKGWYVGVKQLMPSFGQQANVQASGRVTAFWICNVNEDGIEEFDKAGFGGDICTSFVPYTGQAASIAGAVDSAESQQLIRRAEQLLTQAAQQYGSGVRQVRIDGNPYPVENQINIPAVTCQDYMSPKDCQILFNVCDPVICPSSRCDFGGKFPVANVPETGIVGSALLCLPNAKEGIALPVCLTGLASGVDGFVSIMQSHRDCLTEQLETGKTVGICDQIYSVYMCEYFWRQAAPLANALLPKIAEAAYGETSNGGGEYLNVMGAWEQTQDSINYFTQQYAVNSIQAFRVRSVEEAGGEFCKAFASIKAPTSFDALVEPDSPPQFHAWFSSIKYSDATVPATSQYKVYYHIFAGKDTGVSYQVYLKNPGTVSVVSVPQQILIASDFINRGQYASETRDFTAPEGYKELCVNVNGREDCGFGQVSTSFAIDYLSNQARANVLNERNVQGEQECISGSIGQGISLNPNLQATAESAANPAIYNQGIIRICATQNPGSTSNPGRYVQVGVCDSPQVGCWLDTESTARAITPEGNGTITSVNQNLDELRQANEIALREAKGNLLTDEGFNDEYAKTTDLIDNFWYSFAGESLIDAVKARAQATQALQEIDSISAKVFQGDQKAKLQLLRGDAQSAFAGVLKLSLGQAKSADTATPATSQPATQAPFNTEATTTTTIPTGSENSISSTTDSRTSADIPATNSDAVAGGIDPDTETMSGTGNNALDEALKQINSLRGDYGNNRAFVDNLYNGGNELLSLSEYNEINGKGATNFEEDMLYVHRILAQKAAKIIAAQGGIAPIEFEPAAADIQGYAYFTDERGEASQLYLSGLPMPVYVATVEDVRTISMPDKKTPFSYSPLKVGEVLSRPGNFALSLNDGTESQEYLGSDLYKLLQGKIIDLE